MPNNKVYFKSKTLGEIEQFNSQSKLISPATMQYLSSLSNEEQITGQQLIAGLESRKIIEAITEGEKIDRVFSSVVNPYKKKVGYTEPPKMADTYKKMATDFYKVFDDVITGKSQTGSQLIKNVISINGELNQNITYSQTKQVTTFNRVMDSAKRMMADIKAGKEVGFFDIESIGGKNEHGFQELNDITEFAYQGYQRGADGKLTTTTYSSVIGLIDDASGTKYNATKKELQELASIPKTSWTERQKILVNAYSKYGHKNTIITPNTDKSIWRVDNLETAADGIDTIETALKGLDVRRTIGEAQKNAAAANGGVFEYQQQYNEMISKIASKDVITAGHNILKFDVPMLNRSASAAGSQFIDTSESALYDMVPAMRFLGEAKGKDFYYKNKLNSIMNIRGLTANQQEAITRILYGEAGNEQHSALQDTSQYASLFFEKQENGSAFFENIFADLQELDATTNKIQYKYSGANKQLFYINNTERFDGYNTKNALNMTIDPVSGQYRTFNGYAMDAVGNVEKEAFGQSGSMRRNTLGTFEIMKYESTDELIKLLNPADRENATIPEMAQKQGYVLAVTPYYDKEMAQQLGVQYDAAMSRKTLYFHDTYDSLLGQLSNAVPVAELKNGAINPIEENLRNEELKLFNMIDGQVQDITPGSAKEHIDQLRKLHVERYTNEHAAEQARKLTFSKYSDISNAFIKDKANKTEVMQGITRLSELVAKGVPLTQDVQLLTTLGFVSNGSPKLYSETINKTANLAGYLYDQQPIFNEIINQINGVDYMSGTSKEAIANRDSAFVSGYNALLEFLSQDQDAIKNGRPTTIVGSSQLDYLNIKTSDLTTKAKNAVGKSISEAKEDYTRIHLNRGGLISKLAEAKQIPNTSVTNFQGSQGFALLKQFVDDMDKSEDFRGALNFSKSEIETYANADAYHFETAIMNKLKDFTHKKRVDHPSFGYGNETNMTQNVIDPHALVSMALDSNGKLLPKAKAVIENAVKSTPRSYKIYDDKTGITDLVEMLTNKMFSLSRDDFEESLKGLTTEDIKTGMYNFDLAKKSAKTYAENIAKGIFNSDIQLAQGKNDLFLLREGKYAELKLPNFKAQNGLLYAQVDNTKNALFPYLNINKAITKNGLDYSKIGYESSFARGIDYSLESSMHYAYQNGHDPLNAMLGWIKNTKQNIREHSPAFQSINPRIMSEQYHQDISELINATRYLKDDKMLQGLQAKGLLPKDFMSNLENVLKNEDLYESFSELGSKEKVTFSIFKQNILHALADHPEIRDEEVKRMLRMASDSAKDTNVAAGKVATSTMVGIGGGEVTNTTRPLINQALDSMQYRKDLVESRLKSAGIASKVALGSVLSNPKSNFLQSTVDKSTGYTMINTVSAKFLAMDQLSFNKMLVSEKEKANNAFDKAASKIASGEEKAGIAKKIFEKMKTLNLHEQELLINTRLSESVHYKSQIQTISSRKKMMVQFERDLETQEAIETYNKLVPEIKADGTIAYKPGMKVKKGDKLFSVEGYNDVQKYSAKHDGVLRYGFYNQYEELIDTKEINKLISGKGFTDIGQIEEFLDNTHGIESKYAVLPKELQRPKLIVSGAEKGVTDFIYAGAGSFDKNVREKLKAVGLADDIGIAYSDDYLDYLVSTHKLNAKDIKAIKAERHIVGNVMSDLLDTNNTGILGVINQNISGHNNANLMLESIIGHIKDSGKIMDKDVKEHLEKAFGGAAQISENGVFIPESLYGKPININEINTAAQKAGLTYTIGDKTMYGKLYEKNGAQGSIIYGSVVQDNDWGGGTSASTDIKAIDERIAKAQQAINSRNLQLGLHANKPYLKPEEVVQIQNQINTLEKGILNLHDKKDVARAIEKGAVYSDRLDMTLNMRQYDTDTLNTIKSKLINPEEFQKYYGHALSSEGALSDEFKNTPFLQPWTSQIKNEMINRQETKDAASEIISGSYAMNYNDVKNRTISLDKMLDKDHGFKVVDIRNADFAIAGQARETIMSDRNVYTNNLMLDLGQEFGENRYLAVSKDSARISGDSLIKESRKEKLNALKSSYDRYNTAGITAEEQSVLKKRILDVKDEYLALEKINITGKEGKMENVLKMRLNNSSNGKVSMLTVIQGEGYDALKTPEEKLKQLRKYNSSILETSTFDGKSILQHYAEGKSLDVQYKSASALRDMGYFEESFMRDALGDKTTKDIKTLESMMKERLRTQGDAVLTQRFPIMKEGSGKVSLLYLADDLQGEQTKIVGASAYAMKADVDGDTILTSMMKTKNGKSFMSASQDESGEALVRAQKAALIDRAVNQNMALESDVQKALIKDKTNALIDLNSIVKNDMIDGSIYGSLNGVSNVTRQQALNSVESTRKYVDAARQSLADDGLETTGASLHDKVIRLIQDEHAGNTAVISSLTQDYAISTRYQKLLVEETAKVLKGTVGEVNRINKKIREAYFLTADRADERFSMNTNLLAHVLDETEEGAISAKKVIDTVDPARIEQWRNYTRNIFEGREVSKSISGMKTWLMDNVGIDKLEAKAQATRQTSNMYKEMTENIVGDKKKFVANFIDTFGDVMSSMANNKGLKALNKGYFDFGEKMSGISAKQLENIYVSENDETIRGMFTRLLRDDSKGNVGILLDKEDLAADVRRQSKKILSDGREWLEGESTGQKMKTVLKSTGELFEKITKGLNGKTLAFGALGLAGAYLVAGFVGGNPSRPAETQAMEDNQDYNVPSLLDQNLQNAQSNKQPGYVVNINAKTNQDKQYASQAINNAVSGSYNTNVNISMNITNDNGNINDRYIEQLLAGAM